MIIMFDIIDIVEITVAMLLGGQPSCRWAKSEREMNKRLKKQL